jgi:hypothetical protein
MRGRVAVRLTTILAALLLAAPASAKEVTSNGTGGGAWSDPATWRGGVPGPDDDAVVSKGDLVVFDRNDDGKPTCQKLYLDPQSGLIFKQGAGKLVMTLAGPAECYGTVKLDGSASKDDHFEIRFTGKGPAAERAMKFLKGGGLVLNGRPGLADGACNVVLSAEHNPMLGTSEPGATVECVAGVRIDAQRVYFHNVMLTASGIDNTGAKPNERLNILGCKFDVSGRIMLTSCDTPLVADCSFQARKEGVGYPAIGLSYTTLVEVRGNTIKGLYQTGISGGFAQTDGTVLNNTIEGSTTGIYWAGSTGMIKGNLLKDCPTQAMVLTSAACVVEECVIDGCRIGLYIGPATVQATNCRFVRLPKDAQPFYLVTGELTLLNCNITPEQVVFHKPLQKADKPRVTALEYVIVGVKGTTPDGTQVELRTTGPGKPAEGASDPNVRNGPALVTAGRTPLPQALNPLIVASWGYDAKAQLVAAPEYTLKLLAPADGAGGPRKVLKEMAVKPQPGWFREKPNDPVPTVEVTLP